MRMVRLEFGRRRKTVRWAPGRSQSRLVVVSLLVATGFLAGFTDVSAQPVSGTGVISGMATDSISGGPLIGADVFVWNSSIRTQTDADGRFSLPGVPAGDQQLIMMHPLLLELGVSSGAQNVLVEPEATVYVALATPSPLTIIRNLCLLDGTDSRVAVVAGVVEDAEQGVVLGGARVQLNWHDEDGEIQSSEVATNSRGWYRFCSVPADVDAGVKAIYLNRQSPRTPLRVAAAAAEWIALPMGDFEPGALSGVLTDVARSWAVEDAEVSLAGTRFRTVSNREGTFRFQRVPTGSYILRVAHIAYGEREVTIEIESGMGVKVEVPMSTEAIVLDPILVEGKALAYSDDIIPGGRLMDAEAIDAVRHRASDVADILRMMHLRDVIIRRGPQGQVCVGISSGQARFMKQNCTPMVIYVDNARISDAAIIMAMPPDIVEKMVVYRPVEAGTLFGPHGVDGVLAIFTRRGHRNE